MKRKNKVFLAAAVLLFVALGLLMPRIVSILTDMRLASRVTRIEEKENPDPKGADFWEMLQNAGRMKQTVDLRDGKNLNGIEAEQRAEHVFDRLTAFQVAEETMKVEDWVVSPVLASSVDDPEATQVQWRCVAVWPGRGQEDTSVKKVEILLDDASGYMISFTIMPAFGTEMGTVSSEETEKTDEGLILRNRLAESVLAFLNDYYPSEGRTEFRCKGDPSGHQFTFFTENTKGDVYEYYFFITENGGQIVFNM